MEKKRSIGVVLLSIFVFLCAITAFFFLSAAVSIDINPPGKMWKLIALAVQLGWFFIGVTCVIGGIGLLLLKSWGSSALLFVTCPLLVFMGSLLTWINPSDAILFGASFILPLAMFVYFLNRPKIKEQLQ